MTPEFVSNEAIASARPVRAAIQIPIDRDGHFEIALRADPGPDAWARVPLMWIVKEDRVHGRKVLHADIRGAACIRFVFDDGPAAEHKIAVYEF